MLLLRSEEHVEKWLAAWRLARGAILSLDQCWRLAQAWYGADRRDLAYRRKTAEEAEEVFQDLGLTTPFWKLR